MVSNRRSPPFENRRAAARRLGEALREQDIAVAKKIGAPNNPEFAVGAVAADGSVWLNADVIERREIPRDYVASTRAEMAEAVQQKAKRYRESEAMPDLAGKRVCLVDDGVATGATVRACLEQIRQANPEHIVLAVPVGSPQAISALESLVDEVVCLETPSGFRAVGQYYEQFEQVSDEDAMSSLTEE